MAYAEHVIAVITEDPERAALIQRGITPIARGLRFHHIDALAGAVQRLVPPDAALADERLVPHLIVLDDWPGSARTLQQIRAADALVDVRVIVLCQTHSARDVAEAYRLGASSCLFVPADADEFVAMMQEAGRYWLLLNRWPTW